MDYGGFNEIVYTVFKVVYVAVVQELNKEHNEKDWVAYIINDQEIDLEMALIVSEGYSETKKTTKFRHSIQNLPKKAYAKIELLQEQVFKLNNLFYVTFFADGKMYEKKYLFRKNTINEKALQDIPLMEVRGVLVK